MRRTDLPKLISDTGRILRTLVDQRGRELGLTRAQGVVLFRLVKEDGQRQIDLADYLEVEPISAARLVDRLEQSGYVTRLADPQDRRVKRVYLTDQGRAAQIAFKEALDAVFDDAFDGLAEDRIDALWRDLDEVKNRFTLQLSKASRRI